MPQRPPLTRREEERPVELAIPRQPALRTGRLLRRHTAQPRRLRTRLLPLRTLQPLADRRPGEPPLAGPEERPVRLAGPRTRQREKPEARRVRREARRRVRRE